MSWNKGSLELENGEVKYQTFYICLNSSNISSFNIIFLDEFAYVPATVAEQFLVQYILQYHLYNQQHLIIVSTPLEYEYVLQNME